MFGAPMNYDAGSGERLHKDTAKKPGRKSQKRHDTFTYQAAVRLADRHVLDFARRVLTKKEEQIPGSGLPGLQGRRLGSQFVLEIGQPLEDEFSTSSDEEIENRRLEVKIVGLRGLSTQNLDRLLYPRLVEFLALYSLSIGNVSRNIMCCTECVDEDGLLYRAHHDYRSNGFWHDWAWVSYEDEESEEGYTDVPAKLLCFLPNGFGENDERLVVCHACQWEHTVRSPLAREWRLMTPNQRTHNGIPYDVVPFSALCGHCLVVPDLNCEGTVYEIDRPCNWHRNFT
jgi:hypothetical protein